MQSLLRLDLPEQIYEEAIQMGSKTDLRGLPSRLATFLSRKSLFGFSASNLIHILVTIVHDGFRRKNSVDEIVNTLDWNVVFEAIRTLRVLLRDKNKNVSLREKLNGQLKATLLRIDEMSDAEAETLLNLLGVTAPQANFFSGQVVQTVEGNRYVVVDQSRDRKLLYFDEKNPGKQQIIDTEVEEAELFNNFKLIPVSDLRQSESIEAARNSVLMDAEVLSKLIDLARKSDSQGIGKLSVITARALAAAVCRGMKIMIETLQMEFIDHLKQKDLFDKLVSYMVMVSGQSSLPFDQVLKESSLLEAEAAANLLHMSYTKQKDLSISSFINKEFT